MKKKVSIVFGTRPEAIKLCPIILELRKHPEFEPRVCVTAQHREMLDQVLEVFSIGPDIDLNLMEENQTLANFASRCIAELDSYYKKEKPDLVIVQGDTTTTFVASLAAFYNKIPIGHVEAGLRTSNKYSPFPEEVNRVLTSHIADLDFAPTETARQNLLKEGIAAERIFVTGNTVIDALLFAVEKVRKSSVEISGLPSHLMGPGNGRKIVLITGHRRESFGAGFESICKAIAELARLFPETQFVYPVHLNPNVQNPVFHILGNSISKNIHLIEPLPYLQFVALMNRAAVILTDSGGIQEEAPSLGKPVLVMRGTTERPEAIEAGSAKLVGTHDKKIVDETSRLLTDKVAYDSMAHVKNPYGDGRAAGRIVNACAQFLENVQPHREP
jgi:UDP-N-acetylglucosamine 2-epimerase (non-hydrolysing)